MTCRKADNGTSTAPALCLWFQSQRRSRADTGITEHFLIFVLNLALSWEGKPIVVTRRLLPLCSTCFLRTLQKRVNKQNHPSTLRALLWDAEVWQCKNKGAKEKKIAQETVSQIQVCSLSRVFISGKKFWKHPQCQSSHETGRLLPFLPCWVSPETRAEGRR